MCELLPPKPNLQCADYPLATNNSPPPPPRNCGLGAKAPDTREQRPGGATRCRYRRDQHHRHRTPVGGLSRTLLKREAGGRPPASPNRQASIDRTSSSVRDYGVEGGGESPAPLHCGPASGIRMLEDVQIIPPRTTMDPHQTPAQPKTDRMPRTVRMPSESPASPDEDEYRTPIRTPTREVAAATETTRPIGSAREAASRDASRERATVRAADASALRSRAVTADAPLGTAVVASAPRGSVGAVHASRDSTGKPASRDSGGKVGPQKPQTLHLAARKGITATTTTTAAKKKTVTTKTTPTPPGVPQNTPTTPATTVPARIMPISRSQTEMQPPKPQKHQQRPRSRQSECSGKSDRSTETTPERSGSRSSLGPPLTEPRALVERTDTFCQHRSHHRDPAHPKASP
ncbi:hypothetical protein ACJJTC_008869 [Scirpophaga incertulas]